MMKRLHAVYFRTLPNGAHYEYFSYLSDLLPAAGADVQTALAPLMPDFHFWMERETARMLWIRKSLLSQKIMDAYWRIDSALMGINAGVRAARFAMLPQVRESARRLYVMLKSYGRVARQGYEEASGNVTVLLSQFAGDYSSDVVNTGLPDKVAELQAAFHEFSGFIGQRNAEWVQKPDYTFKEARTGLEKVYHRMTRLIDAGGALDASSGFAALIDLLNPLIDRLGRECSRHRRRIDTATNPDPIELQPCTGEPVTPNPAIYDADSGVRLELGKDYNLAFRNNVKPGMAQCIIRGKGKFTGSRAITFSISNS
jgi:hypothetical protein